jgi:hypothetical protein
MRHFRRGTLIALLFTLLLVLCFLVNCTGEPWLDNGAVYLCSECKGKYVLDTVGECQRCEGLTSSSSYKYCYDCAKELNCLLFQSSILNLQFAIKKRLTQHARHSLSPCLSVSPSPCHLVSVSQQKAPSLRRQFFLLL